MSVTILGNPKEEKKYQGQGFQIRYCGKKAHFNLTPTLLNKLFKTGKFEENLSLCV